jgi:Phosphotransferase enzyme family
VHGDLGPGHLLVHVGRLHGVIDWTDAHVGDAALDLAWALHGSTPDFAGGVAATYGVRPDVVRRALDWHLLGPWHEVLHGRLTDRPELVASGLAGACTRLRAGAQ